jgi:DNA-directed RNA polymerase, subunit E''
VRDLEGQISSEYGYCLWCGLEELPGVSPLSDGIVDDEGNAIFTIHYSALYYNLFKDEVVDGIVQEIKPKVQYFHYS